MILAIVILLVFCVDFEVIKNLMGAPTRALQNFFVFKTQRCNNQTS